MYKSMSIIGKLFILFTIFVGLGLMAGISLYLDGSKGGFSSNLYLLNNEEKKNPLTALELLVYILIGTGFLLILSKVFKNKTPFLIIETIVFLFGGFALTYGLFLYFENSSHALFLSALFVVALALRRFINPRGIKNIIAGMSAAGVGALLGISLSPLIALLFVLMLIVYDVVSVFITQHMLDVAKIVIKHELAFTLTASEKGKKVGGKKSIGKSAFRIDLGTGDLLAPILFSVSLYSINSTLPFVAYISSLIGFWVMIGMLYYLKRPIPALLPIMSTSILITFAFAFLNQIQIF